MKYARDMTRIFAGAIGLFALLAASAVQAQSTINVPGDQPTIQAGIQAAQNGDTVLVAPGAYNEAINLQGKAIHVLSSDGPEATTIDGAGLNTSVITCASGESSSTVIEGFTITGGSATFGGGMRNVGSSPTVINCIFVNNNASFGGAISNDFAHVTAIDTRFENNSASNSGGGVDNVFQSTATFEDCVFAGNSASSGGAIANSFFTSCNSHVIGTTFCENTPNDITGTWHNQGGNEFLDTCPDKSVLGDLDGNGVVDVFDLLILLAEWGECADPTPGSCPADLDGNGVVDVFDLLILLANWG